LDLATSGKGGIGTFIGVCAISGAFGVADAHVQGGMVGDLSFMQPEFIQVSLYCQPCEMFHGHQWFHKCLILI
jgi:hypothetical protein